MYNRESDVYTERTVRQGTSFARDVINATIPRRDPRGEARRRLEQYETEHQEMEFRTTGLNTTIGDGGARDQSPKQQHRRGQRSVPGGLASAS